jgi:hypothetical protein
LLTRADLRRKKTFIKKKGKKEIQPSKTTTIGVEEIVGTG